MFCSASCLFNVIVYRHHKVKL